MNKTIKARLVCFALSVVLVLGTAPVAVWALEEGPASASSVTSDEAPASAQVGDPESDDAASTEGIVEDGGDSKADVAESADSSVGGGVVSGPDNAVAEDADAKAGDETAVSAGAKASASDAQDVAKAEAVPTLRASSVKVLSIEAGGSVFLSANGSDANDGLTAGTPVKTFARAKEILGAEGAQIRLLDTITVASDETWSLAEGQMVIRDDNFTSGPMIHVNPGVTFVTGNIVIDGGFGTTNQGVTGSGSYQQSAAIIDANYGMSQPSKGEGAINLSSGTVLRNNHITANSVGGAQNTDGGAIFAKSNGENSVVVEMSGATIDNCSTSAAGGAVAIKNGARFRMKDGSAIFNCSSGYAGGAVSVTSESTGSMSIFVQQDSAIKGCVTKGPGGGVFVDLSKYYLYDGSVIEACVSEMQGGGICLYNGAAALVSGAVDNPIYIRNNSSKSVSPDEKGGGEFGGGGIYVDTTSVSGGYRVSNLYMDAAVVRNNSAAIDGGGVAYCPQGGLKSTFYESNLAMYANSTETGHSDDFAIVRQGSTTADGYKWTISNIAQKDDPNVSSVALGGVAYRWVGPDGSEYALSDLMSVKDFFGKSSIKKGTAADSLATIFIEDNESASFGGGIACNGRMYNWNEIPDTTSLSIEKKWEMGDGTVLPGSARMWVVRSDGEKIGYVDVTPGDDGAWTAKVEGLPKVDSDGNPYTYTVEEEKISGNGGFWKPTVSTSVDEDGNTTAMVTNTMFVNVDVKKVWVGGAAGPVIVTLLADGKPAQRAAIELNEDNDWKATFADLPKYGDDGHVIGYTVVESDVEGYTSAVTGTSSDGFTITNTKDEKPEVSAVDEPEKPTADEPKKKSKKANGTEHKQVSDTDSVMPLTGDDSSLAVELVLMAGTLACAVVVRRRFEQ